MKATLQTNERQYGGAVSDGNLSTLQFPVKTNAAGAVIGTGVATPLAANDILDLGPLQEGLRLEDAQAIIKAPIGGGSIKLGFAYEDGVDRADVPQDNDYFGTFAGGTAARVRTTAANGAVVLPKAARLIATLAGATVANGEAVFIVTGELTGPL